MLELHPVRILLEHGRREVGFNEALFKAVLEEAFKQLLRFILRSAKESLNKHKPNNLQVKTVAIAIPSQWDISFQRLYERLLKEVFAEIFEELAPVVGRDIDVVFHSTATAIAQYFLHATTNDLGLGGLRDYGIIPGIDTTGSNNNTQLFIHCGGHYAVSLGVESHPSDTNVTVCQDSIFTTIQRDESGKRLLCKGGKSQGRS